MSNVYLTPTSMQSQTIAGQILQFRAPTYLQSDLLGATFTGVP
jgi:hypothetical protein